MDYNTRYYSNLEPEEQEEVVKLLLDHLNLEIYNPYEYGPKGVRLREKDSE